MTGFDSKRQAAQDKVAQPVQELVEKVISTAPDRIWLDGYTFEEIEGIRKMHEGGRCMPFIEFKLANGLILRMIKSGGSYVCTLSPQTAHNFLVGEKNT